MNYIKYVVGLQLSMCVQIVKMDLKGVLCVDQPLEDIVSHIAYYRKGEMSYGFIIDGQTRVLTHPLLPYPNDVRSNAKYTFIDSLEKGTDELVQKMIR